MPQLLSAADVPKTPYRPTFNRGVPCAFRWHIGPGQPLAELLGSDALGRAGRNICHSFNATTGTPAKLVRVAFGALFIKQGLGLTDEETVEQVRENPYMQFFLGFSSYSSKPPFDPSMLVNLI